MAKKKKKQNPKKMDGNAHPGFRDERITCKSCNLVFLSEESALNRVSISKQKCARCVAVEREGLVLPTCFGKSYDNANSLCSKICTLKQACIIQFSDGKISNWKLRGGERLSKRKKPASKVELVRILRVAQQPLHVRDLMALLAKVTVGNLTHSREDWKQALIRDLRSSDQIVSLGDGYFMWLGIWNPEVYDGETGYYKPYKKVELFPNEEFYVTRKKELEGREYTMEQYLLKKEK